MKMKKETIFILIFLGLGVILKLFATSQGNFLFNMDNARDFVDVREMVELKMPRLTGPTSGIEGLYTGPGWYYLLAIPYVVSQGNPYSAVILMILLWAVGGYFLLRLARKWGILAQLILATLWLSSNYVNLATVYSFNPNPVILLTPLFIYLLVKYLDKNSLKLSFGLFFLSGLLFNCEMASAIFLPAVVVVVLIVFRRFKFFGSKNFWFGLSGLWIWLLPQLLFDIKYKFSMTQAVFKQLSQSGGVSSDFGTKFLAVYETYKGVLNATMMNWQLLSTLLGIVLFFVAVSQYKRRFMNIDKAVVVSAILFLVTFVGHWISPVNVYSWHVGPPMAAAIILAGFGVSYLSSRSLISKIVTGLVVLLIMIYGVNNLQLMEIFKHRISNDASVFSNQTAAVDYVYSVANGQDFRAYTYLPSVYDYPYQYLFWWLGNQKYGYVPTEYAYAPDMPQYIKNKEKLPSKQSAMSSELVFLIIEPDEMPSRIELWKNHFKAMPLQEIKSLGPLHIETRLSKIP